MVRGRSSTQATMPPRTAAPSSPDTSRNSQQAIPSPGRFSPAVLGAPVKG